MRRHRIRIDAKQPDECFWCHRVVLQRRGVNGKMVNYHKAQTNKHATESVEHQQGKQMLANYFKQKHYHVEIEQYLPQLKQRADMVLMSKQGQLTVIEYQCARISYAAVVRRTQCYQQANLHVHWILGGNYLRQLPYAFLKLSKNGLYAYFFHEEKVEKMTYDAENKYVRRHQNICPRHLRRQIIRGLRYGKTPYRQIQSDLYQAGFNLNAIPDCCLPTVYLTPGPKIPYWYVLLQLWLTLSRGPQSLVVLEHVVTQMPWHKSAFITDTDWRRRCLMDVLQWWTAQQVITWHKNLICLNEKSIIK